ncbi:hypothetical protein GCM10027430_26870 [Lysobacter tyrosinilyticus]
MTVRQGIALLVLLSTPQLALASGGDVLSLIWLEVGLLGLVLGSLVMLRLSALRSLVVFGAYLIAASVALYITRDWPYLDNIVVINSLFVGLPFLAWLVAITCLRRKRA